MDPEVFKEVLVALRRIVKATDARSKRIARETGLSTTQLVALQTVDGATTLTQVELARELGLTQATVTSLVQRMEARGLLTREKSESDRRRVNLKLTAAGVEKLSDSPQALQDLLEGRFAELAGWEQLQLLATLQRLASLMDAEMLDASPVLDTGTLIEP